MTRCIKKRNRISKIGTKRANVSLRSFGNSAPNPLVIVEKQGLAPSPGLDVGRRPLHGGDDHVRLRIGGDDRAHLHVVAIDHAPDLCWRKGVHVHRKGTEHRHFKNRSSFARGRRHTLTRFNYWRLLVKISSACRSVDCLILPFQLKKSIPFV